MLYFAIIAISMMCVEAVTITLSLTINLYTLTYAIVAPFLINFYVLIVLGLTTLFLRVFVPSKCWDCNKKIFKVKEKEIEFFHKIKIKKWKDKIPEMGCTGGFPKNKVKSLETKYLWKFLQETCFAEFMHNIVAFLGFTALFFVSVSDYVFVIPILLVNFVLNILPSIVQRYTRFRIYKIYTRKEQGDNILYQSYKTTT